MSERQGGGGASVGGIGLGGAVFIVFLMLKLTGHINWSWWWVTAPLWGGAALALAISVVVLVLAAVGDALGGGRR